MAYEPTKWKNREVERPRTFTMQNNPDGTVTLVPAEGAVNEPGTPIMAVNMNKIEDELVRQDEVVTTHLDEIASPAKLGHVLVDGETIVINELGKIRVNNIFQQDVVTSPTGTAFGNKVSASGIYAFAIGENTKAIGTLSYAQGVQSEASGLYSHAEGYRTKAAGQRAHAEGYNTIASGSVSHSEGFETIANVYCSHAQGAYNKTLNGSAIDFSATADAFVIGNGTDNAIRSNAFRVTFDGKTYGKAAFNSTGADYAEYFEWSDGNIDSEDRVGYVVTLDGEKIRKALSTDSYILGIVSVNPSVIGDSHQEDWQAKYATDEWGRIRYHYVDVEFEETIPVSGENGTHNETVTKVRQDYVPVLNPQWNNDEEYTPREKRKEWSPVGLMGKLLVRDDGSCIVNSYAKVGQTAGELTTSDEITNMRVIERISDNIVRVFIK